MAGQSRDSFGRRMPAERWDPVGRWIPAGISNRYLETEQPPFLHEPLPPHDPPLPDAASAARVSS
jgi:hypothetical protein